MICSSTLPFCGNVQSFTAYSVPSLSRALYAAFSTLLTVLLLCDLYLFRDGKTNWLLVPRDRSHVKMIIPRMRE
jgi:hypothetical protein